MPRNALTSTRRIRKLCVFGLALLFTACNTDKATAPQDSPNGSVLSRNSAYDRIADLFAKASPLVMAIPGTVFADHDERINKVVVGVENKSVITSVQLVFIALDASSNDYVIEVTEPIRNMATLRDRYRPTQAGIQIQFWTFCTMGFNVDHSAGRSFITNSHCTDTQGGTEGTIYYQPSSDVDPVSIATEADDPHYFVGGVCPSGRRCRYSDAARALYSSGTGSNRGDILKTTGANNGDLTVGGVFTITSQDNSTTNFPIGAVFNKVGRTTGWTQGPVSRTCVNSNVLDSDVHLLCQTFVDAGVDGGDSGSPVFSITSGDNVSLVGILWGGTSSSFVMSPLASIQDELGTVTATAGQPLSVAIAGPTAVKPRVECIWRANVSGGMPPYSYEWRVSTFPFEVQSYYPEMWYTNDARSFRAHLWVTDAGNTTVNVSTWVTVSSGAPVC